MKVKIARQIFIFLICLLILKLLAVELFGGGSFEFSFSKRSKKSKSLYFRSLDYHCATTVGGSNTSDLIVGVKFILYIICHDDKSCEIARKWSQCMPWTRISRVTSSVFFESLAYQTVFPINRNEWRNLDFVGVSTYKSLKFLPLEKLVAYLELAHVKPYDVVPLYGSGEFLLRQAVAGHGSKFKVVWDTTLKSLGYSESSVRAGDKAEVFFRNTFIIKPAWLESLTVFMNQSINTVLHNPEVNDILSSDANYREGKLPVSKLVFKANHYYWHPFVFERLPSFYLHNHGAAVFGSLRQISLFENSEEHVEILYKGL